MKRSTLFGSRLIQINPWNNAVLDASASKVSVPCQELRKPGVPLTPHCMQRFTLVMTGATLVFTVAGRRRVEAAVLYGQACILSQSMRQMPLKHTGLVYLVRHLFQGNSDAKIFVHIFLYSMQSCRSKKGLETSWRVAAACSVYSLS